MSDERIYYVIKFADDLYASADGNRVSARCLAEQFERHKVYEELANSWSRFVPHARVVKVIVRAKQVFDEAAVRREERQRIADAIAYEADGIISFVGVEVDAEEHQKIRLAGHTGELVNRMRAEILALEWRASKRGATRSMPSATSMRACCNRLSRRHARIVEESRGAAMSDRGVFGLGKRFEVRILSDGCWTIFKSFDRVADARACRHEVEDYDSGSRRRVLVFDSHTGATT